MVRFTANSVLVDDANEEFILVGFASGQLDNNQEALHFQRSYQFDEQDAALGMNQVYAERNDQSQSGYGGILRVELYSNRVHVVFDGSLAHRMGTSEIDIALSLPVAEFERLRKALHRVFFGFGVFTEYAV